jgi:hypothetical protein
VKSVADGGTSVIVVAVTDIETATELVEVWKTVVDRKLDPPASTQLCFALLHAAAYANPVPVVGRNTAASSATVTT